MTYSTTSDTSSSSYVWYSPPSTPKFKLSQLKFKEKKVVEKKEELKEQIFLFDPEVLDI